MIATRRRSLARDLWRHRAQYLAIAPFYLLFAAFGFFPLIYSVLLSFNEWTGSGPWQPVGIDNYVALTSNQQFQSALTNTLVYLALGMPILVVTSLVMAVILNNDS